MNDDETPGLLCLLDGREIGIADRYSSAYAPVALELEYAVRYCWECDVAAPGAWCFLCERPTCPDMPPWWRTTAEQDHDSAAITARALAEEIPVHGQPDPTPDTGFGNFYRDEDCYG